jgi:hypothetical protein
VTITWVYNWSDSRVGRPLDQNLPEDIVEEMYKSSQGRCLTGTVFTLTSLLRGIRYTLREGKPS